MDDGLTSGDPLGDDRPATPVPPAAPGPATPERPAPSYGGSGPAPPGAFSPPPRPQRIGPGAPFAPWWKRAVAALVDGTIVVGVTLLVLAALGAGFFSDGEGGVGEIIVSLFLFSIVFAFMALLYAPLLMARTNGQTLGKMVTGCRVVRANGKPVDFWWSVLREVVVKGLAFGIAGSITGGLAYLADFLWPFFDEQNRALHDYAVDSRVVDA